MVNKMPGEVNRKGGKNTERSSRSYYDWQAAARLGQLVKQQWVLQLLAPPVSHGQADVTLWHDCHVIPKTMHLLVWCHLLHTTVFECGTPTHLLIGDCENLWHWSLNPCLERQSCCVYLVSDPGITWSVDIQSYTYTTNNLTCSIFKKKFVWGFGVPTELKLVNPINAQIYV